MLPHLTPILSMSEGTSPLADGHDAVVMQGQEVRQVMQMSATRTRPTIEMRGRSGNESPQSLTTLHGVLEAGRCVLLAVFSPGTLVDEDRRNARGNGEGRLRRGRE
jgi:hypothetical protein